MAGRAADQQHQLNEAGFKFVRKCIDELEARGLEEEGIYRKSAVGTKITRLLAVGLDPKKVDRVFNDERYSDLTDTHTVACAIKMYLRFLKDPLLTHSKYSKLIAAAKEENDNQRLSEIHNLVLNLPNQNFKMLDMIIRHLTEVIKKSDVNKMTAYNMGVVFGPTVLRPLNDTPNTVLDVQYVNSVVVILIENYKTIFVCSGTTSKQKTLQSHSDKSTQKSPKSKMLCCKSGSSSNDFRYAPKKVRRCSTDSQLNHSPSTSGIRVRSLYECRADNPDELSFQPNQVITNVTFEQEPGWILGTLNGKTGLIPENYVERL